MFAMDGKPLWGASGRISAVMIAVFLILTVVSPLVSVDTGGDPVGPKSITGTVYYDDGITPISNEGEVRATSLVDMQTSPIGFDGSYFILLMYDNINNSIDIEYVWTDVLVHGSMSINGSTDFPPFNIVTDIPVPVFPVHNIISGRDFSTIQEAIADIFTFNGDTIVVDPGTYDENIFVYKELTIQGTDPATTIINGLALADVVDISAPRVNFNNFTVRNSGPNPGDAGVQIRDTNNISISDIVYNNCQIGVYVDPSENISLAGLTSGSGNQWHIIIDQGTDVNIDGVNVDDSNANGGGVIKATNSTGISCNNIDWNFEGANIVSGSIFDNTTGVTITNSTLNTTNGTNVKLVLVNNTLISNTYLSATNGTGIFMFDTSNFTFANGGIFMNNGPAIKANKTNGTFHVDSFFDVMYDVDLPTRPPAITFTNTSNAAINNSTVNTTDENVDASAINIQDCDNFTSNGLTLNFHNGTGINIINTQDIDFSVLNIRNGLFRPAPDTQALATSFTERIRITDTGDIGVGGSGILLENTTDGLLRGLRIRSLGGPSVISANCSFIEIDQLNLSACSTVSIDIFDTDNSSVKRSNLTANGTAANITNSESITIQDNYMRDSIVGLKVEMSTDIFVFNNNFINNTDHALDFAGVFWDIGPPFGGNYWDTWTTPDANGDGFVDQPYDVLPAGQDTWPYTTENGWMKVLNQDTGIWYPTIMDAVGAAQSGEHLWLSSSTYMESVMIDRSLTITGEDMPTTIIDGMGTDTIQITSDNVFLNELTILGGTNGVVINNAFGVEIYNCSISNMGGGKDIIVDDNSNLVVFNTLFDPAFVEVLGTGYFQSYNWLTVKVLDTDNANVWIRDDTMPPDPAIYVKRWTMQPIGRGLWGHWCKDFEQNDQGVVGPPLSPYTITASNFTHSGSAPAFMDAPDQYVEVTMVVAPEPANRIHNLDTGTDHTSFSNAFDGAVDGNTLMVYDDTHDQGNAVRENVIITKKINIIGQSRDFTTIENMGPGPVFAIQADGVSISHLTIKTAEPDGAPAIVMDPLRSGLYLENNIIQDEDMGLLLDKNSNWKVNNNTIDTNNVALSVIYDPGAGRCQLIGNTINSPMVGVEFTGVGEDVNLIVSGNTLTEQSMPMEAMQMPIPYASGPGIGFSFTSMNNWTFNGNVVQGWNLAGISIDTCDGWNLNSNTINGWNLGSNNGIEIDNSYGWNLGGSGANNIYGWNLGIKAYNVGCNITGNNIHNNTYGIDVAYTVAVPNDLYIVGNTIDGWNLGTTGVTVDGGSTTSGWNLNDNTIQGWNLAVSASNTDGWNLNNNYIYGWNLAGGTGVQINSCDGWNLGGNTIQGWNLAASNGIQIDTATGWNLGGNTVQGWNLAISVSNVACDLFNNSIHNNTNGLNIGANTTNFTVENNTFRDNTGSAVLIDPDDTIMMQDNDWINNGVAIELMTASATFGINGCTFNGNTYDFLLPDATDLLALNCTLDKWAANMLDPSSGATAKVTIKNYLHVEVYDNTSAAITDATVWVNDTGVVYVAGTTDAYGQLNWIEITDRIVSKSGYIDNTTEVNTSKGAKVFLDAPRVVNMSASTTLIFYESMDGSTLFGYIHVNVTHDNTNITLQWNELTWPPSWTTGYRVYEDADNNISNGFQWSLVQELGSALNHTIPGHYADALSHSYRVRAFNADQGNAALWSNMGYKSSQYINASVWGWNWVSLPYDSSYVNASDITVEWNETYISEISIWSPAVGGFETLFWFEAQSKWAGDFVIPPGAGIKIVAKENFTFKIVGSHDPFFGSYINASVWGWNWVSLPYDSSYVNASDITVEWNETYISEISIWSPAVGGFETLFWFEAQSKWAGDYTIPKGAALKITAKENFTWVPEVFD